MKNLLDKAVPSWLEPAADTSVDETTAPVRDRSARETPGSSPATGGDELAIRVYEETLANGPATVLEVANALRLPTATVEQTMSTLRGLRLVKRCEVSGHYRAVSPDAAHVELVVPLEEAISDKRRELAGIHEKLSSFAETFSTLRRSRPRQEVVVRSHDPREVELRMADLTRDRVGEVLAMWPLGPARAQQDQLLGREALAGGTRLRILCPHTARTSASARAGLRRAAEAGARIRTSNHVFEDLVIVGDDAVFLSEHVEDRDTPLVTIVYEPAVVSLLRRVYEYAWQSGADFQADAVSYGETLDDVKATILDLLASGLKDDVVARRIGMSSRTFRRHISGIMGELNAESRFQAGVAAACAGLVGMREPCPQVGRAG
ncbi:LuxR family transcriptional regulator [Streptomyces sp. NPDC006184]|uniref:LuxR family transcriptional regulator n=1 Tax=Streptomyces sp. NPDC006184 TaxID=3155455 RepID=UPI0033B5B8DE